MCWRVRAPDWVEDLRRLYRTAVHLALILNGFLYSVGFQHISLPGRLCSGHVLAGPHVHFLAEEDIWNGLRRLLDPVHARVHERLVIRVDDVAQVGLLHLLFEAGEVVLEGAVGALGLRVWIK